jgi:hypothetical protein
MRMNDMGVLESIMQSADQEAFSGGYAEITPAHLAIALSRFSEREPSHSTASVIAAVRHEFEALGIEPRTFRRRLRRVLGKKEGDAGGGAIQASNACKAVFACAERIAAQEQVPMQPLHMVRALFLFLAECGEPAKDELPDCGRPQPLEDIPTEL